MTTRDDVLAAMDPLKTQCADVAKSNTEAVMDLVQSALTAGFDLGATANAEAVAIAVEGLHMDGGHHKQWYLERIIVALGAELPPDTQVDRGTPP